MADLQIDVSLKEIARGYKFFEEDQVLTADQLNDLTRYFDDSERLTRVALIGVGILCGLRVVFAANKITVTKGVAITTDGDILRVPENLEFSRFREYAAAAPKYDLFFDGNNRKKIWEVVGREVNGAGELAGFTAASQKPLSDMTAVLLMESFTKDGDICTGGDCDNKGKDVVSNVKLLLLEHKDIQPLRGRLDTIDDVARQLDVAFADRVILTEKITTVALFAAEYKKACENTRQRLLAALGGIFRLGSSFLGDIFTRDPLPGWTAKINQEVGALTDGGVQAYYGFLKDVVDAYNEFRESLFGHFAVCNPSVSAFQKHVVLGAVGASSLTVDANRTLFYPSPLFCSCHGALERIRFLARRLDTLIMSFTAKVDANLPLTVTPSRTEEHPIERRAIPAYYALKTPEAWPIHRAWSYTLEQRGHAEHNYGARGAGFGAKGAAADPLSARIGGFSLFRVEGHIGKDSTAVVAELGTKIKEKNLPFMVRAVLVSHEKLRIRIKPPVRYTDLHRFHYLLRQNVVEQLDDVVFNAGEVIRRVGDEIDAKRVSNAPLGAGQPAIREFAVATKQKVATTVDNTKAKLTKSYVDYRNDPQKKWRTDVADALNETASFKVTLGDVARTDYALPHDLLVTHNARLVDWLDVIIEERERTQDDKLLFPTFIKEHPQAEHCGGAPYGGTFIVLYGEDGRVVGDVALPCCWEEEAEEPEKVPDPPPKIRLPIDKGIKVRPPIDDIITTNIRTHLGEFKEKEVDRIGDRIKLTTTDLIKTKLDDFKKEQIDPVREQTKDFTKNYITAVQDTLNHTRDQGAKFREEYVKAVNESMTAVRTQSTEFQKQYVDAIKESFRASREQTAELQKSYVDAMKDTIDVAAKVAAPSKTVSTPTTPGRIGEIRIPDLPTIRNVALDREVRTLITRRNTVDELRRDALDPALDDAKRAAAAENLKAAEKALGTAIVKASEAIAAADIDPGTDASAAMTVISDAFEKLNNERATEFGARVKAAVAGAGVKPEVKNTMTVMLSRRGIG